MERQPIQINATHQECVAMAQLVLEREPYFHEQFEAGMILADGFMNDFVYFYSQDDAPEFEGMEPGTRVMVDIPAEIHDCLVAFAVDRSDELEQHMAVFGVGRDRLEEFLGRWSL